jgi:hypothetical protein
MQNQNGGKRQDPFGQSNMHFKRSKYGSNEDPDFTEVKISHNFTSSESSDILILREKSVNIKVDKLAFNGNSMINDYHDGKLIYNPSNMKVIFRIEFKLKSNSKNANLGKYYRLDFHSRHTKIRRRGTRKFELQFEKYMSLISEVSSFEKKKSIDTQLIFPKKGSYGNSMNMNHKEHSLTFRINDREISKLNENFKALRPNISKSSHISGKIKKYETARYLKDPGEPGTRKKIENYEKKIEKAKKERILKRLKEIPYPRFWTLSGGSKSSARKGETGLLKRVKQSTEFNDHPFKSKILCPIYSCYKVFDSVDKSNEHLRVKHSKIFEVGFKIKENGKLKFDGDLDRMKKNAFIFSKFQNDFIDKVIIEKGKKKLDELKKEIHQGKSKLSESF